MDLIQARKRNKPKLSSLIDTQRKCLMKIANEDRATTYTKGFRASLLERPFSSNNNRKQNRMRRIVLGAIILTLICVLVNPLAEQRSEAKKIKEKKVLKQLVKGLIFKNLSTKKNFLPLPVPIPVPIELNEPPVYLKGKPEYVTVYKRTPVVKPAPVYHMPTYPASYGYMMNPYSLYSSMMLAGSPTDYQSYASSNNGHLKSSNAYSTSSSLSGSAINFNDFDDDYDNYYTPAAKSGAEANTGKKNRRGSMIRRASKKQHDTAGAWLTPTDEEESIDHDDNKEHGRIKRQAYESSYENEPPCYGFPLEVNIKSRIKMDQLFPIRGNSQFKKCIKVGRPLLPPVEDKPPYVHIFTLNKPY